MPRGTLAGFLVLTLVDLTVIGLTLKMESRRHVTVRILALGLHAARAPARHDLSGPPPSSNSVRYLCSGYFVTCSHHWIGSGDGARTSPFTSASRQYANRSSSNSRCLAENEANGRHSRISSMPSSAWARR